MFFPATRDDRTAVLFLAALDSNSSACHARARALRIAPSPSVYRRPARVSYRQQLLRLIWRRNSDLIRRALGHRLIADGRFERANRLASIIAQDAGAAAYFEPDRTAKAVNSADHPIPSLQLARRIATVHCIVVFLSARARGDKITNRVR